MNDATSAESAAEDAARAGADIEVPTDQPQTAEHTTQTIADLADADPANPQHPDTGNAARP